MATTSVTAAAAIASPVSNDQYKTAYLANKRDFKTNQPMIQAQVFKAFGCRGTWEGRTNAITADSHIVTKMTEQEKNGEVATIDEDLNNIQNTWAKATSLLANATNAYTLLTQNNKHIVWATEIRTIQTQLSSYCALFQDRMKWLPTAAKNLKTVLETPPAPPADPIIVVPPRPWIFFRSTPMPVVEDSNIPPLDSLPTPPITPRGEAQDLEESKDHTGEDPSGVKKHPPVPVADVNKNGKKNTTNTSTK